MYIIKGRAGTGKTEKIKQLVTKADKIYVVVCPTNKAVSVLKKRGVKAFTIHAALFEPTATGEFKTILEPILNQITNRPLKDDEGLVIYKETKEEIVKFEFNQEALRAKKIIDQNTEIKNVTLIIDESSMISAPMWFNLINKFDGDIIAVGDDRQLPPIEGEIDELRKVLKKTSNIYSKERLDELLPYENFFLKYNADETLTEQFRQKEGSPILDVANTIENTGFIPYPFSSNKVVCDNWDIKNTTFYSPEMVILAGMDVVIAFRTSVCSLANSIIRSIIFKEEFKLLNEDQARMPRKGDKLYVDVKYTSGIWPEEQVSITKGQNLVINEIIEYDIKNNIVIADVLDESDHLYKNIPISLYFVTGKVTRLPIKYLTVSYGYVLTCHKCQGSQWENVGIIDECHYYMTKNWRYTAVTRASNSLYIAKYKNVPSLGGGL